MLVTYLEQIERAAAAKGVTLEAAAVAAGLPDSTPWRWRRGRTQGPRLDVAERVMAALDKIDIRWPIGDVPHWEALIGHLKEARHRTGKSQLALDEDIGNPQGLVAKWECGMRRPTAWNLYCWADALGVRITLSGVPRNVPGV